MKGIHKEIQKLQGSDVDKHILNSRIVASDADFQKSTAREQQDVLAKWHQLPPDSIRKQSKKEMFNDDILRLRPHSKDKVKDKEDKEDHASYVRTSETQIVAPVPRSAAFAYAPEALQQISSYDSEELERAIQESVKVTSKGNAEQDRSIERAIRASVSEFQYMARNPPTEEEAYQQAIRASMARDYRGGQELRTEAGGPSVAWVGEAREQRAQELQPSGATGGSWLTDDPELEQALHKSLIEQDIHSGHVGAEELQRALRESGKHRSSAHGPDNQDKLQRDSRMYQKTTEAESGLYEEHDEELSKVIEESRRLDREREAKRQEEEQFVMEYVMKASLAEQ